MLMQLFLLATIAQPPQKTESAITDLTVKDAVCVHRPPAVQGASVRILAAPTLKRSNFTGVLLLVNCSSRRIVSVRDPDGSSRHVRRFVYDPEFRVRMWNDPHDYEALNFNEDVRNSTFEKTAYSRWDVWKGPCKYDGLELTTVAADDPRDRETTTFSIDICRNNLVALLSPISGTRAAPSAKPAR